MGISCRCRFCHFYYYSVFFFDCGRVQIIGRGADVEVVSDSSSWLIFCREKQSHVRVPRKCFALCTGAIGKACRCRVVTDVSACRSCRYFLEIGADMYHWYSRPGRRRCRLTAALSRLAVLAPRAGTVQWSSSRCALRATGRGPSFCRWCSRQSHLIEETRPGC